MDPDAALAHIVAMMLAGFTPDDDTDNGEDMRDIVNGLVAWVNRGGFLPTLETDDDVRAWETYIGPRKTSRYFTGA